MLLDHWRWLMEPPYPLVTAYWTPSPHSVLVVYGPLWLKSRMICTFCHPLQEYTIVLVRIPSKQHIVYLIQCTIINHNKPFHQWWRGVSAGNGSKCLTMISACWPSILSRLPVLPHSLLLDSLFFVFIISWCLHTIEFNLSDVEVSIFTEVYWELSIT